MNPLHWEDAFQRLHRDQDPNHQTVNNRIVDSTSGTDVHWPYSRCSKYTDDEPQNRLLGVKLGSERFSFPSQNFYTNESELEELDGEPMRMDEDDPVLPRMRKELREQEKQILRKTFAPALKTVKPFVETLSPAFPSNKRSDTYNGASLKDKVNFILQQRRTLGFDSDAQPPKDRANSSSLNKDGLQQGDHPLKLRVKELMRQRCRGPCILPTNTKVPGVSSHPPSQSITSPATSQGKGINQGFQRFLSVLNKGVDMDLLSRIVNDDNHLDPEPLNIQPPAVENESELPVRSESRRSNSGASLPGHGRTTSRETSTRSPTRKRSLSDHLPDNDDKTNDRRCDHFGSSSRSRSPPAAKKRKAEEEKPKVDEQHEQLQNILKTLGLSLEADEMSELTSRTQERLYGKKHESRERERDSNRFPRTSSCSSSSTSHLSFSRSSSRSVSPSPSRRRRSRSRDSRQSLTSERVGSRERSRDGPTYQDDQLDSEEGPKHGHRDEGAFHPPYPPNHEYPHPAAFAALPDYSSSRYDTYHSEAAHSYWRYTEDVVSPSIYPSSHPWLQSTFPPFPSPVVTSKEVFPQQMNLKDINLLVNPDLSVSEGQSGPSSDLRCLQVVRVKQANTQKHQQQHWRPQRMSEDWTKSRHLYTREMAAVKQMEQAEAKAKALEEVEDDRDSKGRQPEKEKQLPTDEEIKANLRKKLEEFNQKVKQKTTWPDNSLMPQTG